MPPAARPRRKRRWSSLGSTGGRGALPARARRLPASRAAEGCGHEEELRRPTSKSVSRLRAGREVRLARRRRRYAPDGPLPHGHAQGQPHLVERVDSELRRKGVLRCSAGDAIVTPEGGWLTHPTQARSVAGFSTKIEVECTSEADAREAERSRERGAETSREDPKLSPKSSG